MVEGSLLADLGFVIIAATLLSLVMKFLKQPLVLGYVLGGILIGPAIFQIVKGTSGIAGLSELGVAFLLFIIGLELDIKKVRQVGAVSLLVGVFQVALTFALGFGVSKMLGLPDLAAFYIGFGVAFSSTMVVIKLLAENRELESLHGQLVLGIMLVQDIAAVFVLALLPHLNSFSLAFVGSFALKVLLFFILVLLASLFIIPRLMRFVGNSSEVLFMTALTIIFAFGYLAHYLEFSYAIGAFLAGVALSSSPLHLDIGAKIAPLRDFFLVLFFVVFGMQLSFNNIGALIIPIVVIVVVATLGKALITFSLLKIFRFGNRTSFLTAVQKAQVSEFSLVLVTSGVALQHISAEVSSILTIGALITILLTPYIIGADDKLFLLFSRAFPFFKAEGDREDSIGKMEKHLKGHIIIFGFHKMTPSIVRTFTRQKKKFVVVDHNPEKIQKLAKNGVNCLCGSMTTEEVYEKVHLDEARAVISTIPRTDKNEMLIHYLKQHNKKALIIVAAAHVHDAIDLYKAGAHYVILPESLGGEKVSNYFEHLTPTEIKEWGKKHVKNLHEELDDAKKWATI